MPGLAVGRTTRPQRGAWLIACRAFLPFQRAVETYARGKWCRRDSVGHVARRFAARTRIDKRAHVLLDDFSVARGCAVSRVLASRGLFECAPARASATRAAVRRHAQLSGETPKCQKVGSKTHGMKGHGLDAFPPLAQ